MLSNRSRAQQQNSKNLHDTIETTLVMHWYLICRIISNKYFMWQYTIVTMGGYIQFVFARAIICIKNIREI